MNRSSAATIAAASWGDADGAISSRWGRLLTIAGSRSQRDVAVLALRARFALALQGAQRDDQLRPRLVGDDDVVDVAALGSGVRVGEPRLVVVHQLFAALVGRRAAGDVAPVDDVDGALRPHHRDLGGRPREVEV